MIWLSKKDKRDASQSFLFGFCLTDTLFYVVKHFKGTPHTVTCDLEGLRAKKGHSTIHPKFMVTNYIPYIVVEMEKGEMTWIKKQRMVSQVGFLKRKKKNQKQKK